jgi:hypothetical protein
LVFNLTCRKKLARRLLHNRSVNDVRERNVLNKLEQCYGQLSTSKIKCMFTDIAYSRDTQIRFRDHLSAHPELNPGICMDVTVLRKGLWPTYRTFHMKLPAEMVNKMFLVNLGLYFQYDPDSKAVNSSYSCVFM